MEEQPILNEHRKEEFPPMHTSEFDTRLIRNLIIKYL